MKKKFMIAAVVAVICATAIALFLGRDSSAGKVTELLNLGNKYLLEQDFEQAIAAFEKAIEIDPKCEEAYRGLADVYVGMGNYESAINILQQGFDQTASEGMSAYLAEIGDAYMRMQIEACRGEAEAHVAMGNYESAIGVLKKGIEQTASEELSAYLKEVQDSYARLQAEAAKKDAEETAKKTEEPAAVPEPEAPKTPTVIAARPVDPPAPAPAPVAPPAPEPLPVETPEPVPPAEPEVTLVNVRATQIQADSVFNDNGYGSLTINGNGKGWDEDDAVWPQAALADRNGNLLFPYESTFENYYVSDDIVHLGSEAVIINDEDDARHYKIDGSEAFVLEGSSETTTEGDTKNISWECGPIRDGYAWGIKHITTSNLDQRSYSSEEQYYVVDQNGTVVYIPLPGRFIKTDAGKKQHKQEGYMSYRLGWCGEGLFAVYYGEGDYYYWGDLIECKGYMDTAGNMVIDLSGRGYVDLWPFNGGLAVVKDAAGMCGVIDKAGNLVIPCIYESLGNVSEDGLFAAKTGGKWGYIDRNGNVVLPFEYDAAYGAGGGLASVGKGGKYGLVDYSNKVVVPLEYDDISSPVNGVVYAIKNRTLHIIQEAIGG